MTAAAAELRTGTVTMLFSDIEGLHQAAGQARADAYREVLTLQRRIDPCEAVRAHDGIEMGTEGDSFFVVFSSAGDAVRRRCGPAWRWPGGVLAGRRPRSGSGWACTPGSRSGTRTGTSAWTCTAPPGSRAPPTAARWSSPRRLGGWRPPERAGRRWSSRDLGWHRLKDLPEPERLYQLTADHLRRTFPPIRSLGAGSNLPLVATSLIGRDDELRELRDLIERDGVRALTLTGAGGSGKTRLAIALAATLDTVFADGVFFVPLESSTTLDAAWTTIADAIGVTGEVRGPQTVVDDIAGRHALLVLDNLEQLRDAAALVEQLLTAGARIHLVVTSRRALHVAGEHEHVVPPLTLPSAGASTQELGRSGAVTLFVQRARMLRPDFALTADNAVNVGEICRRLDGLPLAIELAAARVKLLGIRGLLARLGQALEMTSLQQGRPDRQKTLRATIEWSHALLSPEQQRSFRQLAVFRGDFDLPAMAAVLATDGDALDELTALIDGSLVAIASSPDDEPRFRLLETIAAYAGERLAEAGELAEARRRHAEHYLGVVEMEAPRLRSGQFLSARNRIEADLDNVRAALDWSLRPDDGSADRLITGLRLCEHLGWFWYACGYQREGHDWLDHAVAVAAGQESPELMNSLHALGVLVLQRGEADRARDALRTCLDFWRRDGDPHKIGRELNSLGVAHRSLGEPDVARHMFAEAITVSRQAGDREREASALSNLANLEADGGDHGRAVELLTAALALDRQLGDDWGVGADMVNLAVVTLQAGHVDEAAELLATHATDIVRLERLGAHG